MSKRPIPPSRRRERIPPSVLQLVERFSSLAAPGSSKQAIREASLHALQSGVISYRQDAWGVYHVQLPNNDEPFLLPPPDFPRGHPPLAPLLEFIRRNRVDVPKEAIKAAEGSPEGTQHLHLLTALALMAGDGATVTASDSEIAYFVGWDDEDVSGKPAFEPEHPES